MAHPLAINQYVNFDPYLDIDGLKSMNEYLMKSIAKSTWYIGANANGREDGLIDVGHYEREFQKDSALKTEIGDMSFDERSRYFLLKHNAGFLGYSLRIVIAKDYLTKHDPAQCIIHKDIEKFGLLIDWINAQSVFSMFGRIVVFITPAGIVHPHHHDYYFLGGGDKLGRVDEFLWLRTNSLKSFGLYDNSSPRVFTPIESYSAWFNNDQYHGGSPHPATEWSFSIRVDGVFTEEFRKIVYAEGLNLRS
jgi:hypothetical protein